MSIVKRGHSTPFIRIKIRFRNLVPVNWYSLMTSLRILDLIPFRESDIRYIMISLKESKFLVKLSHFKAFRGVSNSIQGICYSLKNDVIDITNYKRSYSYLRIWNSLNYDVIELIRRIWFRLNRNHLMVKDQNEPGGWCLILS